MSGPAGSTLHGATGSLFTLQPGDTTYTTLPVSTPLAPCQGYWAYFPTGGSLVPGQGNGIAGCTKTVAAGTWVMIGDPLATASVGVTGADSMLTYDPAAGYQQVSTLPAGRGAWAYATGGLLAEGNPPPRATPTAPAQP